LERRFNNFTPLQIFVDYPQTNRYIGIYGYPGDKVDRRGNIYMYGAYGGYTLRSNDLVRYQIDTMGGQSGSALIVFQENGTIGIIGVHTIGDASPMPTYN
jgi:V8-like Glu-specific endopeptidase